MTDTQPASGGESNEPGRRDALRARYEGYKTKTLERLEAERERRVSVRVAYDFVRRDQAFAGSLLAGGVSVKLFLWFLPFALSVVAIIGTLADQLDQPAEELARDAGLAAVLGSLVADAVEVSTRARWYLVILGIVLLLWAGLGVVRALALTSRLAWRMPETPPIRKLYGSMGVAGIVLGILFVQWARNRLTGGSWYADLLVLAVAIVILGGIFLLMFTWLPRPNEVPWTAMVPGALLMTVGLLAIRLVTLVYFSRRLGSADDLYGGLGLSVVFLAWLYIISRLLVASIALNATIWQRDHIVAETPEPSI